MIYHNEIDEACCGVLRRRFSNSIVDERSIAHVQPDEIAGFWQCHFFAGVGGFSLGFERAGMPEDLNVWTGGFPCQDLSVAGRREGLAGERSGLYFEFQRLVAIHRPRYVVVENVPGLLSSSHGRDFAVVVGGLTGVVPEVPRRGWGNAGLFRGPVYSVAYRVLDARHFGVPQRRRRVFIVANIASGRAAEILFEREGVRGNSPARRAAGEDVASAIARSAGHHGRSSPRGDGTDNLIAYAIQQNDGGSHKRKDRPHGGMYVRETDTSLTVGTTDTTAICYGGNNTSGSIDVSTAPNAHGGTGRIDFESETFVVKGASAAADSVIGFTPRRTDATPGEVSPPVSAGGGGSQAPGASGPFGVRRLTPVECERLQGFPDDWCAGQSDSTIYKQMGNAVCVPVVEWIGRRIMRAEGIA